MVTNKRLINAHDLWSDIMMLPHNGDMISSEEVEQAIVEAPTVDAVEVKHGRWIKGYPIHCSVCGGAAPTDYEDCNRYEAWLTPYCPNCGADMRERKDND